MHTRHDVITRDTTYLYTRMHIASYTVAPTPLIALHYQMSDSYELWRICIDKWGIYMRRDSFISDMTHAYETSRIRACHDVFICDNAYSNLYCRSHSADGSALSNECFMWDVTHL